MPPPALRTSQLRVAIITRHHFRSPRYLALGLQRMLGRLGVRADCFPHGLAWLKALSDPHPTGRKLGIACIASLWLRFLHRYDLIVVSDTVGVGRELSLLAPLKRLAKPIFNYEVFALGGCRYFLDQFPPDALSQFDAYLVASAIHDDPPVPGPPVFEVGLQILEEPSQSNERAALAMIDFPRVGYERDREIQLSALETVGIPHFSLEGEFNFSGIAAQYRRPTVAFLAFPEAFGVPIVQLQQQGALIASPHRGWAKRQALLAAGSIFDERAPFSENFMFYDDERDLVRRLRGHAQEANPAMVARRLHELQPQLVSGNPRELRRALDYAQQLARNR